MKYWNSYPLSQIWGNIKGKALDERGPNTGLGCLVSI